MLAIQELTEFNVFEKSQLKTGIDYWLGTTNTLRQVLSFFSRQARLEVTGIEKETKSNNLKIRINAKMKQVEKSAYTGLPVYIVAVEFGTPQSQIIIK